MSDTPNTSVLQWLENAGLPQYADLFESNRISLGMLLTLSGEELKEIGVTAFGDRKELLAAIAKTRSDSKPPPPPAPPRAQTFAIAPPPFTPASPTGAVIAPVIAAPPEIVIAGAPPPPDLLTGVPGGKKKRWSWKSFGGRFLLLSVAAHVLFGLGATYYVVQTIQAKRKLTFQAGPKSPNPNQRSVEHKVQMAKKQNTMSAPVQPKRITTTGASKFALPDMPALPKSDNAVAGKMAGMGGVGSAFSMAGTGGPSGGTGGAGLTLFGFRDTKSGALDGTFYDLKQTPGHKPTGMDPDKWRAFVQGWVKGSWDEAELKKFYVAPRKLHAPFIFVPFMSASEGPKAFDVEKQVQPRLWVAHYKGKVAPTQSGRFRFVGCGDDCLIVRFNNKVVLNQILNVAADPEAGAKPPVAYPYAGLLRAPGAGRWFEVNAGESYDMEVLVGECPGGIMYFFLQLEKSTGHYEKDPAGLPILPIFRVANVVPKEVPPEDMKPVPVPPGSPPIFFGKTPPFSVKDPPWSIAKPSVGLFKTP